MAKSLTIETPNVNTPPEIAALAAAMPAAREASDRAQARRVAAHDRLEALRQRAADVEQEIRDAAARGDAETLSALESELAVLPSTTRAAELAFEGAQKAAADAGSALSKLHREEGILRGRERHAAALGRADKVASDIVNTARSLGELIAKWEREATEVKAAADSLAQYERHAGPARNALLLLRDEVTRMSATTRGLRLVEVSVPVVPFS